MRIFLRIKITHTLYESIGKENVETERSFEILQYIKNDTSQTITNHIINIAGITG